MLLLLSLLCCHTPQLSDLGQPGETPLLLKSQEVFAVGQPIRVGEWSSPPPIKICGDIITHRARIVSSILWWTRLGYRFGEITVENTSEVCRNPTASWRGIVISLPSTGYDYKYLALTKTYMDSAKKEIRRARIQVRPDSITKERVVEHEIGHAIGWQHYPQKYHMMHPEWKYGGYNVRGMRK